MSKARSRVRPETRSARPPPRRVPSVGTRRCQGVLTCWEVFPEGGAGTFAPPPHPHCRQQGPVLGWVAGAQENTGYAHENKRYFCKMMKFA